jgi:Ca2+-binding RTX toxin-like protein
MPVESFEGLTPSDNAPAYPYGAGMLTPGYNSAYTFKSGVVLISPIPNDSLLWPAVGGDFKLGNATWGLLGNGHVGEGDVPDGTAYMAGSGFNAFLDFGFTEKVYSVGAYVDAGPMNQIALTAWDANGNQLDLNFVNDVPAGQWHTNYLAVSSDVPIARIEFFADFIIVDKLTFSTQKPDVVRGTRGDDVIGKGRATNDDDIIRAWTGDDLVKGRGGSDLLRGGRDNDALKGGQADDTLIGGKGKDSLTGGDGLDAFVLHDLGSADRLRDFDPAEDLIVLDQRTFTGLAARRLDPVQFRTEPDAVDADDCILHDVTTGKLYYDADGNGAAPPC